MTRSEEVRARRRWGWRHDLEGADELEEEFGSELAVATDERDVIRGEKHEVADLEGDVAAMLIGVVRLALLSRE